MREHARKAVEQLGRGSTERWDSFAAMVRSARSGDDGDLAEKLAALRRELPEAQALFYLSVPPEGAEAVIDELADAGLTGDAKVILEKPFGEDLRSARSLRAAVDRAFSGDRVFRIDHFLGKEAVQNLLAMRFANGLLGPAWNSEHIAQVQIDVPETLSIEGRAEFYETTGALRDMIASHLLQVLGFVAMEPPASLSPADLHASRLEVIEALAPLDPAQVVRGQYAGYRDEDGVDESSRTETFVALRAEIDNERWRGVPFFLRTGKSLADSAQLVTLVLGAPDHDFAELGRAELESDRVLFDLKDPGSVDIHLLAKQPGTGFAVAPAGMRMELRQDGLVEAYERLLLDAMAGDQTLFADPRTVERLWEAAAPVLDDPSEPEPYEQGSWGPPAASEMTTGRCAERASRSAGRRSRRSLTSRAQRP